MLPEATIQQPDEVARGADLVLLAVPDDALPGLVRGLVATESLRPGQIVVHTSGAHGVEVLQPASEAGALPLALHPAMTFTGRPEDIERLTTACVAVTAEAGNEAAWNVAEVLALELGAEPVRLDEQARKLYHTALSHGANHLITLVNECADLLRNAGIDIAERVMAPVLSASLDNALRFGDKAYTGPVARGDAETVRAHLDTLRETKPELLASYIELAKRTADRATASGVLRQDAAAQVRQVLREWS